MSSRLRIRPSLELLEDRTCPTLKLSLLTGGTLLITGTPSSLAPGSSVLLTATANNQFLVQEKNGVTVLDTLGKYNVGSNLIIQVANHINNAINIDLNGKTFGGNVLVNGGVGGSAVSKNDPIQIFNGNVGGNVTVLGGKGFEQVNLGQSVSGFPLIPVNIGGAVSITAGRGTGTTGTVQFVPGSKVGGDLNIVGYQNVGIGQFGLPIINLGGSLNVSNPFNGGVRIGSVEGNIGGNVNVTGTENLLPGDLIHVNMDANIAGNVNVSFGGGLNRILLDSGSIINGNLNYSAQGNNTESFDTFAGTVNGNSAIQLGDGNTAPGAGVDFDPAATFNGNLSITTGNGVNDLANSNPFLAAVSGNLTIKQGNGDESLVPFLMQGTVGGKFIWSSGNGPNELDLGNGTTQNYNIDALFGNNNDIVMMDLGAGQLTGRINGGGRLGVPPGNVFNQISGDLSPYFLLSNFP